MSKASDNRIKEMRAVCDRVMAEGITNRTEIARLIRELAPLGRTERWQGGIEGWAVMVESEENPLDWAFGQGSIYASHAA